MATLYVVRGYPGQGKSVYCSKTLSDIPHFENDQYFMHNGVYEYDRDKMKSAISWCMDMVDNCLRNGIDVCVSNTFTKVKYVEAYRRLSKKHDAKLKVYRMMGEFNNTHNVPKFILENMKSGFEDYSGEIYVYPKKDGTYEYTDKMK